MLLQYAAPRVHLSFALHVVGVMRSPSHRSTRTCPERLVRSPRLCGGALPDAGKLVLAAVCPGALVETSRVGRSPTWSSDRVHDSLQECARVALYAAANLPWQSGKNRLLF